MIPDAFRTIDGSAVAAVTAAEMHEVDRVSVEEFGLTLPQMMENAGRNLAAHCHRLRDDGQLVILAGGGGNGGGGLACARHVSNRDVPVRIVLDRDPDDLAGAVAQQYRILDAQSVELVTDLEQLETIDIIVDALIGYGLDEAPYGRPAELIEWLSEMSSPVLSLDVPSGVDATTGDAPGVAVEPDRTMTLALPKTGLQSVSGDIYLADIAIPRAVYREVGIPYVNPFGEEYWVEIER